MLTWLIEYQGYSVPLERVSVPAIMEQIEPVRVELQTAFAEFTSADGELVVVFMLDDDRHLSVVLRGDSLLINRARDILGAEHAIGRLLN